MRSIPRSRTNPQFNRDTLPDALAPEHIDYVHLAELGGRRSRRKDEAPSLNAYWTHPAFRNYADYAMSDVFRAGLTQLLALGHRHRCAIMCAEAVWWRCHRRIITDYLLLHDDVALERLQGPDNAFGRLAQQIFQVRFIAYRVEFSLHS